MTFHAGSKSSATHILLGAPVSVALASCVAGSGCHLCLYPGPALPEWSGIRSPGTGYSSDSGSCPLPGRRKGLWGSHSPRPSSPVWGSRRQMSCLCALPCLHCGPGPWTAYPPQSSCCPHPWCLLESHSCPPAKMELRYWNLKMLQPETLLLP